MLARFPRAQVSLSVALPYITFLIADRLLGVSGAIAVVMAGMTLNFLGPGRLSPLNWTNLREIWDVLVHWAGALIFLLAALLVPRLLGDVQLRDLGLIGVVVLAAIAARVFMLNVVLPLLTAMRLLPRVDRPYRVAILWGGLRGAVTLALALAVTENLNVPADIRREVGILATGFTLFTLLVQGTTLRWIISFLGLDKLSQLDRALSNQAIAVALQNVREEVANTTKRHELSHDIVRSEAKRFAERLDGAMEKAEGVDEIPDRDRITLGLVALAGRERDMILDTFREQLISARLADLLHELLRRREEEIQSALDGLRLQYPGYAEEIERRFIRRTSLRLEEREYDILCQDGLIGRELFTTLKQELCEKRKRAEARPALDLAVQKTELVRQFPLFTHMDEDRRARLAQALKTRYVQPGEVLMRKGDIPREVYFIASGAFEVEVAGQKSQLGRGEMFGQLALLSRQMRRTQVTAISHSTLLVLDGARFRRLLDRNETIREAVRDSAKQRGIDIKILGISE